MKRFLDSARRAFLLAALAAAAVLVLTGCGGSVDSGRIDDGGALGGGETQGGTPNPDAELSGGADSSLIADSSDIVDSSAAADSADVVDSSGGADSSNIADTSAIAGVPGADAVIILKRTTAEFTGTGVNVVQSGVYGTIVEISKSGRYIVQGTLEQGFVAVSKKELNVTLVLNGVDIYCKNYAAITCLKKSDVVVELAENTVNRLADGGVGADADGKYAYDYDVDEAPNAALLVRKDLTIRGGGKLIVTGGANNGIGSRAGLKIEGGDITVSAAANNAIKGNDSLVITGGALNLSAAGAGIKTEHDLVVYSGTFTIDSKGDAVHSDGTILINGGTFGIASGDDGFHADTSLTINGGTINISKCYEGLESYNINLNGGLVKIKSADDGINISGGGGASATVPTRPGQGGGRPGQMGGGGGGEANNGGLLSITGGEYYVESSADGLDSNGDIVMSGGTVVVCGPDSNMEVPIDYNGSFAMTGGTLVATGYYGGNMAQQPGASSTQYTFMAKNMSAAAGSLINVASASGAEVVTVKVEKAARGIVVCSPLLDKGTYTISSGGNHSGAVNAVNLLVGGTYSGGAVLKTFTISNIVTTVN